MNIMVYGLVLIVSSQIPSKEYVDVTRLMQIVFQDSMGPPT